MQSVVYYGHVVKIFQIREILKEFLSTSDSGEVARCIRELDAEPIVLVYESYIMNHRSFRKYCSEMCDGPPTLLPPTIDPKPEILT